MGTWEDSRGLSRSDDGAIVELARRYVRGGGHAAIARGIGTRLGLLGKVMGGAFGLGMKDRVRDLLAQVEIVEPEHVDIFGFSRGAGEAMLLAAELDRLGKPVRLMGLFDAVPQRWIPGVGNDGMPRRAPGNVRETVHAMAAHESRRTFPVYRLEGALERWFPGRHGDQGGRSAIVGGDPYQAAFRWLLTFAANTGLPMDTTEVLPLDGLTSAVAKEDLASSRQGAWRNGDRGFLVGIERRLP